MTQIEMDVARSAVRKNKAVAEYYESQNAIYNCIDWEQRRYEIAKDVFVTLLGNDDVLRDAAMNHHTRHVAMCARDFADLLIAELKKEPTE